MSSGRPETREAILEAARRRFERRGVPDVDLEEIAREAGVSRQAIYLHFGKRTNLLVALAEHVDRTELGDTSHRDAPTAQAELAAFVAFHGGYYPRVYAIAKAFDEARRQDPAAAAGWNDRMRARHEACTRVVERLAREDALSKTWNRDDAADVLYALTSIRTWEELVLDRGWPNERYVERVAHVARTTLAS